MGQTRTYTCPKCGEKFELIEGFGMIWHSFTKEMFYPTSKDSFELNFYNELDKKILEDIHKFIETAEEVIVPNAYYQPYICNKCGKIESKIYFCIISQKSGKTYCPKYTCECGGRYKKLTNKNNKQLYCHKCGTIMSEEENVFWD